MSGNMEDWYMTHENMVTLMQFMADQAEYDKGDMAYATEKPWKFEAVFRAAERTVDASAPKDARDKMMLNAQYGKRARTTEEDLPPRIWCVQCNAHHVPEQHAESHDG